MGEKVIDTIELTEAMFAIEKSQKQQIHVINKEFVKYIMVIPSNSVK